MKHFIAVYFPEQWSITNGGVPVCHLEGEHNNQVFAEFVADAMNAAQQSGQTDVCPTCHGDKGAYLDGHWTECIGCNATGVRR